MVINPTTLKWTAPTQNTDGEPITYELDYEMGAGEPLEPMYIVVGSLQTDGVYQAPLSDAEFDEGENTIALRAIRRDVPDLKSAWSNAVTFEIARVVPKAPFAVAVA